ncbi:hypothetical protein PsorP6_012733 [Peronosclerospora sorghi]|uniref:Uncharacterized protein n=1 Tax=Peronosclerospora sorghi TaxID=230839 RepID=A0ACC0WJQ9_9STRA|nr:hypothetical protein PsorP6_012733 [Peronosclerospora sorghi]
MPKPFVVLLLLSAVGPNCVADVTSQKSQMVFPDHEPTIKHGRRRLRAHDGGEQVIAEERRGEFAHNILIDIDEILGGIQLGERQTIEELAAIARAERDARVARIEQLITDTYGQQFLEKGISIHVLTSRNADQMWVRLYRTFLLDRMSATQNLIIAKREPLTPDQASQVRDENFEQMLAYRVPPASVRHLAFYKQYLKFLKQEHSKVDALLTNSNAQGPSESIMPSSEAVIQELDRINRDLEIPLFRNLEDNEVDRP